MSQLNSILINLSQRILHTSQSNKIRLTKLLLSSLDNDYFSQIILIDIKTFYQLYSYIQKFYQQRYEEQIIDSFFINTQIQEKFVCIYHLIFDMALNNNDIDKKQQFLNVILEMNQNQKNMLMQFVGQVVKREIFIKKDQIKQKQRNNQNYHHQNDYYQQYQQLKNLHTQLQRKHQDLQQSYDILKLSYETKDKQMKYLQQQKLQLLAQLGLHLNSSYIQIIQKYKKDIHQYSKDIQKIQKQLQDMKNQHSHKTLQNKQIIKKFTLKQQQLQIYYKQRLFSQKNKYLLLQKQLQKYGQIQSQNKFQILRLKDAVVNLRKDIQGKNIQLNEQEKIIEKFNVMKKIHLEYRKQVISNLRNVDVNSGEMNVGF